MPSMADARSYLTWVPGPVDMVKLNQEAIMTCQAVEQQYAVTRG